MNLFMKEANSHIRTWKVKAIGPSRLEDSKLSFWFLVETPRIKESLHVFLGDVIKEGLEETKS